MSKFKNQLGRLGFASYAAYLQSEHWSAFKTSYRASGASMRCEEEVARRKCIAASRQQPPIKGDWKALLAARKAGSKTESP